MRAGLLRHRLEIQAVAGEQAGSGEPSKEWTTTATVWGSVDPLQGRERMMAQQVQSEVTHRIVVRGRDVSPANRIKFGDRIFNLIEAIDPAERGISRTFMAQEQVA